MRFERRTIWALVITLALFEGVARLAAPLIPSPSAWPSVETQVKSAQLAAMSAAPDLMVMGSSVTEAGVDPSLLDERLASIDGVYNSALPFSTLEAQVTWLEHVVIPTARPDLLVLGLPPLLGEFQGEFLAPGIVSAADPTWSDRLFAWSRLASLRGSLAQLDANRARQELIDSQTWTPLGQQTGYYDKDGERNPHAALAVMQYTAKHFSDLTQFLETAGEAGMEVVVLIEPWSTSGRSAAEIERFRDWVEAVEAHVDSPVIDATTESWPASLYADGVHFNREGTVAFTHYLANEIESLLAGAQLNRRSADVP